MKKTANPIALAVLFVSFSSVSSCKKDKEETPAETVNGKVKTMTSKHTSGSYGSETTSKFSYDFQGRMTIREDFTSTGAPWGKITFSYATNKVTYQSYDSIGTNVVSTNVYNLNSSGLLSSIENTSSTFTYDSEGHLIGGAGDTYSYTFTYTDGNLTTRVSTSTGTTTTINYTYFTDKPDLIDFGLAFRGKGSKNLPKTGTSSNGNTTNYTYEFDSKGRVNKATETTTGSSSFTQVSTYTYFD